MTGPTHSDTTDWCRFWTDAEGDHRESARPGRTHGMADLLDRFFERADWTDRHDRNDLPDRSDRSDPPDSLDRPNSFAAVGCGPADCPLELADRYPDLDVSAFDATEPAVREARERASERDLSDRRFGCVEGEHVEVRVAVGQFQRAVGGTTPYRRERVRSGERIGRV